MSLAFAKVEGAGNDFVLLDGFAAPPAWPLPEGVPLLCDRRRGIGADGVLVVAPDARADFRFLAYNADGSLARMCGNGLRCAYRWLVAAGRLAGDPARAATDAGVLRVWREGEAVAAEVGRPEVLWADRPLRADGYEARASLVCVGTVSLVLFLVRPVRRRALGAPARRFLAAAGLSSPVNVVFASVQGPGELCQRTWERGCGETRACATGAAAAVVAGTRSGMLQPPVVVRFVGGRLEVSWPDREGPVVVTGPARVVFTGRWPARGADG